MNGKVPEVLGDTVDPVTLVICQVTQGHVGAVGLCIGNYGFSQRAPIEAFAVGSGNLFQRSGLVLAPEYVAGARRSATE